MSQSSPTAPTQVSPPETPGGRGTALIWILLAGAFVMVLNETVMGVALPPLMREFGVTASAGQWLTTAYMLVMAVLIPMSGFLLQRFTPRAIFVAALGLFTLGTAAAAFAPAFAILVVARIAQAAGTAVMMPLLTTTILTRIPAERRGRMMGLIAIVMSAAPALGPTFSGLLITAIGWRAVFIAVLPIAVLVLVIGGLLIGPGEKGSAGKFDVPSALLSVVAFGGLVYGLGSIGQAVDGNAPLSPAIPIAAGAVGLAFFIWRQLVLQRRGTAFLDLRPFTNRPFWIGIVLISVVMLSMFGSLILLPIYMQNVLGLTPLATGLAVLPGGLLMGLAAPFVGALFDKVGARPLVVPGAFVVSIALVLFMQLGAASPVWLVVVAMLVLNLGIAFMMTPLMTSSLGSLAPELYSHGSAIFSTVQQLAGAVGTAMFVTLMAVGTSNAVTAGDDAVAATSQGIHVAFVVAAASSVLAIVLAFFVPKQQQVGAEH
ncbi:MDR family MFS transporter [Leucobacter aridicollis]|uniref:MDR family MFS transporter n=1 Tax=Leucobacter aridicollis TaxID=283878 RepID=UPI000E64B756|nr:DHA2 family efflux MFS transporter permease subunit [Leucobacter aridicollis]UTX52592.1 DHA2 family efflux MFS transporter permease subunit [Leucobacter aridicollis]